MREATLDDMPRLLEMGRRFHAAKQDLYPFVEEDTEAFFKGIIATGVVLITDDGFLAGVAAGNPSNQSYRTAHEIFWWSEGKSGLRLMRGFCEWAEAQGCQEVKFSHPANEPIVERILRRNGFEPSEQVYRREAACASQQ